MELPTVSPAASHI